MLKREAFGSANVESIVKMTDSQQQTFMLEWVNKFMEGRARKAVFLKEQFWGETQDMNPLLDPEVREEMTDDERILCAFYVSMSGLCKSLLEHEEFDPLSLGVDAPAEFYVDNDALVDFMLNSPFDNIAAHMAQIMRNNALVLMSDACYLPAKDFLNELWCSKHQEVLSTVSKCPVPLSDYTETVIESLRAIDTHLEKGDEMGLSQEEIFMHDSLIGRFKKKYELKLVPAVQELNTWLQANRMLPGVLDKFETKVRMLFSRYGDMIEDEELALDYLMAVAEEIVELS